MRKLLDLYCCQGGAGAGYYRAGFDVIGVDISPQPQNPHPTIVSDALEYVRMLGTRIHMYDLIHASPPCQHDSKTQRLRGNDHPDLIALTREVLEETGVPYVIENVGDAVPKLIRPVELCGSMFGLTRTYRHRYFETGGWTLPEPQHPAHVAPQAKMGRMPREGEVIQAIGNFAGSPIIRKEWDVPWMSRDGIREAIPPAYSEYIGKQWIEAHW